MTIRYEEFTANPREGLSQVAEFFGTTIESSKLEELTKGVSVRSVGKWKSQLTDEQVTAIDQVAGDLLGRLHYK